MVNMFLYFIIPSLVYNMQESDDLPYYLSNELPLGYPDLLQLCSNIQFVHSPFNILSGEDCNNESNKKVIHQRPRIKITKFKHPAFPSKERIKYSLSPNLSQNSASILLTSPILMSGSKLSLDMPHQSNLLNNESPIISNVPKIDSCKDNETKHYGNFTQSCSFCNINICDIPKITLLTNKSCVQQITCGNLGTDRQQLYLSGDKFTSNSHKSFLLTEIDTYNEYERYNLPSANPNIECSSCDCSYSEITKDVRGYDFSQYHALDLLKNCQICNRYSPTFLCLHCLKPLCPSHVKAHREESAYSIKNCTLFVTIKEIFTKFNRIFWCEKCLRFTWSYTDEYEPFIDRIAVTLGSYLNRPSTDIIFKEYYVDNNKQAEYHSKNKKWVSTTLYRSNSSISPIIKRTDLNKRADPIVKSIFQDENDSLLFDNTSKDRTCASISEVSSPDLNKSFWVTAKGNKKNVKSNLNLLALSAELQGWRTTQEDATCVFTVDSVFYGENALNFSCAIFGIFDGHGGWQVAHQVSTHIERFIKASFIEEPYLQIDKNENCIKTSSVNSEMIRNPFSECFSKCVYKTRPIFI